MGSAETTWNPIGSPTTKMENCIEIFVLYLSTISLFHHFPWLMCLPEMPHMILLLICDLLQLQNHNMMPKKDPLLLYQALHVVCPI